MNLHATFPAYFILPLLIGLNWMSKMALGDMLLFANSDIPSCPVNCTCNPNTAATLSVDCINRTDGSSSQLSEELNQYLRDSFFNLTTLAIVNSPLASVPASVCRLTNLKSLKLDYNKLSELPVNCFTVMDKLVEFSVEYNELTEIQVCAMFLLRWYSFIGSCIFILLIDWPFE